MVRQLLVLVVPYVAHARLRGTFLRARHLDFCDRAAADARRELLQVRTAAGVRPSAGGGRRLLLFALILVLALIENAVSEYVLLTMFASR